MEDELLNEVPEEIVEEDPIDIVEDESFNTVSSGDAGSASEVVVIDNSASEELLMTISEDVQYLVEASVDGYLSSSIVDVFDRVVDSHDYNYYVAFRGSDSSEGYLYLSNYCSSNSLDDCTVVHMYRASSGENYSYDYYYQVSYDDSESFNFGNNAMYYTNVVPGYPELGDSGMKHLTDVVIILMIAVFVFSCMIRRKVKQC